MRIFPFLLLLLFAFGCSNEPAPSPSENDTLKIVCTTGMIEDMVLSIVGENADVEALMGPGVDPHLFKASHGDVQKLQEADVIFYNGLHLEAKLADILEKMSKRPDKTVLAVAEQLPHDRLILADDETEIHDPHVWFDVELWSETADPIATILSEKMPSKASEFKANAEKRKESLSALHESVKSQLATIPETNRMLITAHDAFEYYGRAYSIEVKGLQGISTAAEAGLKDVTNLVDLIVNRQIKAVFVEQTVSSRDLEAVIAGCKERGHEAALGGTLFSDAMGEKGKPEGTYDGMVRHNTNTIVTSLQ